MVEVRMQEEAHKFGRHEHLVGVVTRPTTVAPGAPAVIIVNAGFVHHVGPFQLHVQMAREIAKLGLYVLRFDLSGIGDSGLPPVRQPVSERKLADIGDAIAFMSECAQTDSIVMAGLCSGAVDSLNAATRFDRVQGVVMLDPPAYPDALSKVIGYAERISNPARLLLYARRKSRELVTGNADDKARAPLIHKPMPAEQFAGRIESTTKRGVSYMVAYTRNDAYKHRKQLYSALTDETPRSQIAVYRFPKFDHTQILRADRLVVIETICRWLSERGELLAREPLEGSSAALFNSRDGFVNERSAVEGL
jgi:dienelactone hydrolase